MRLILVLGWLNHSKMAEKDFGSFGSLGIWIDKHVKINNILRFKQGFSIKYSMNAKLYLFSPAIEGTKLTYY